MKRIRVHAILILAWMMVVAIFVLDTFTPLGAAEWLLYPVPLLIACWVMGDRLTYALAGVCTGLTLAGLFLSPSGLAPHIAIVNRTLGIGVIWIAAVLLVRRRRSQEEVERARDELAALASEQRDAHDALRTTIDTMPAGVIIADATGAITLANRSANGMMGGQVTGDVHRLDGGYAVHHPDGSHFPPDDLPLPRALRGEQSRRVELVIRTDSGQECVGLVDATPLHDANGQIRGAVATVHDVTELVHTQQELARQNELTQRLAADAQRRAAEMEATISAIADGVMIYNADASIAKINAAGQKMLGYTPGECARPFGERAARLRLMLAESGSRDPADMPAKRALRGETVTGVEMLVWLPGEEVPTHISASAAPIRDADGNVTGAVAIFIDISESRRTQEALVRRTAELTASEAALSETAARLREAAEHLEQRVQERMAELEAIFNSLPDAVYVGNENGITRCNRKALDILGCESLKDLQDKIPTLSAKLQNRYADTGQRIPPEEEAFTIALGGQPHTYEVISRNLKTGQDIIQRVAANPILRNGRVIGAVGIGIDITERKRMEAAAANAAERLAEQTQRLQILNQIDQAILASTSPKEIARVALDRLRDLVPCDRASVWIYDDDAKQAVVLAASGGGATAFTTGDRVPLAQVRIPDEHYRGEYHIVVDLQYEHRGEPVAEVLVQQQVRSHLSLPLVCDGQMVGSLNLASYTPGAFGAVTAEVVRPLAHSLAVAVQNARLHERVVAHRTQLQAYARQLMEAVEVERKSIARELHDEAGQSLTALKIGLGVLRKTDLSHAEVADRAEELIELTDCIMDGLHRLSVNLRPASLDRLGLVPALEQYVASYKKQTGIEVQTAAIGMKDERLPEEIETVIYRVVQEALTNISRHAKATQVGVIVERQGHEVMAIVEDNGTGFNVEEAMQRGRLGLVGICERAEALGGSMTVESSPGHGATVYVTVPLTGP